MERQKLQREIRKRVQGKLFPILEEYGLGTGDLDAVMKWKPVVLLLGNYSSGKSTLVNELLERPVQLTGQAPTDDSFTVLTAPEPGEPEGAIPGATLVNDDDLPFTVLKTYGDRLISHFQMKQIDLPLLENLAIVDTPGMLDSVTEKGRGYDFSGVVGEFARLADLVVLMFDPHKAGTIKETYTTIRNTLPLTAEEDRVVFVMSRVDECDTPSDLIRSYGTLCWNLSQMTGRKDIPRIYLTHAPSAALHAKGEVAWIDERAELKQKIMDTPDVKISHILHLVDRKLFEVKLVAQAMHRVTREGRRLLRKNLKGGFLAGLVLFCFLDMLIFRVIGISGNPLLPSLIGGGAAPPQFAIPGAGFLVAVIISLFWFTRWRLPRLRKSALNDLDRLVTLETDFHRNTWARVRDKAAKLVERVTFGRLYDSHQKNLQLVETFTREDLKKYFAKIRQPRLSEALEAEEDYMAGNLPGLPPEGKYAPETNDPGR